MFRVGVDNLGRVSVDPIPSYRGEARDFLLWLDSEFIDELDPLPNGRTRQEHTIWGIVRRPFFVEGVCYHAGESVKIRETRVDGVLQEARVVEVRRDEAVTIDITTSDDHMMRLARATRMTPQ